MIKYTMHHGRMNDLFREKRLCRLDIVDKGLDLGQRALEGMQWAIDMGIEKGSNLYNNLESRWLDYPEAERARKQQEISEFMLTTPVSIKQLIDQALDKNEDLTLEQVASLTDHATWLNAFKEQDILTDPNIKPLTALDGPAGLIYSLTPEERATYFQDYIGSFIHTDIRDANEDVFGKKADAATARAQELIKPGNRDAAIGAVEGALGIKDVAGTGGREEALAKASLNRFYFREGGRAPDGSLYPEPTVLPDGTTVTDFTHGAGERLGVDFGAALKRNPSAGSLDRLTRDLPPSLLKGAFKMGILKNEDFKELNDLYMAKNHAESIQHLETGKKTMELSDVVKIEKAREAQTISDIFHNMSGIEKIVLIVGAVLAARTDLGKKAMIGLGAVYFGQKFLFKNENPIDNTWSPILQGLAKKSKDLTEPFRNLLGIETPNEKITARSLDTRINAVQTFLTEHAREDLDSSVAGFTLLADMPLNQLAPYLIIGNEGRSAYLDASSRDFQRIVKDLQKKNGLSTRSVNTFFGTEGTEKINDPTLIDKIGFDKVNKNLLESGNALKVVFYKIATRNPAYKRDVMLIEQAASRKFDGYNFPPGSTVINGEEIDLQQRFEFLVLQGMKEADGTTLGDFIAQSISAKEGPSADEIEQINREKFAKKITEVREYEFDGKPANLDAKFEGDTVQVGIRKGGIKRPITMKVSEFLNMKPEEIGQKWTEGAVALLKDDIKKNPTSLYPQFEVEAMGEKVRYGADLAGLMPIAETPAYVLMRASTDEIYKKYDEWATTLPRTSADPFK